MKFSKGAPVVGLAAVLVGCGGGGSDSAKAPDSGSEPMPPTPTETQLADVRSASSDFNTAVAKVNNVAPESDVTAAQKALAVFRKAIDNAKDVDASVLVGFENAYNSAERELKTKTEARTAHLGRQRQGQVAMENRAWETAIDQYNVSAIATINDNLNGTRNLDISFENNAVNIELRNSRNGIPIPSTGMMVSTGMTASRFTIAENRSRGSIATSFSQAGTRRTYADYFFDVYDTSTTTYTATIYPIAGITSGAMETLENLKLVPRRILTPLSQQGFSKGRDWSKGGVSSVSLLL